MTLLTVAYLFLGSISDFGLNMQSSVKHGASYVVEHKEEVVSPSVEKSEEENPDLEDKLEKAKEKEEGKRKDAKQKSQQSQPNSLPKNPKDESSPPKSSPSQSSSQSSPKSSSHPSSSSSSSTPSSKTTLPSSSLSPSSVSFSSHWNHSTEAYLFVLTNDKPMHLIWALEASLRNVSSTRRRIALVTDGVSHSIRQVLEKLDIEVRRIPNLSHPKFKVTEARWKDTLSKLAIFDQTDLTKFFYLDADIIINYNMDDLFELDTDGMIHAMRDNSGCFNDVPKLNAGLMIGSPSPTLKKNLLNALDDPENPTKDGMGDQDLLNFYLNKQYVNGTKIPPLPSQTLSFHILSLSYPIFHLTTAK